MKTDFNASEIRHFTLPNGLDCWLKEIHTVPMVSVWIWYGVGARNEQPGKTGISHWVEHLQFKGTQARSGAEMEDQINRIGGSWNAFTSHDWTTYYENLPASAMKVALEIEADRMRGTLFNPDDVETERTVIISEREGAENDPTFRLNEQVQSHTFTDHPYGCEVIGSMEDLRALRRDDLYQHYQDHYHPGNARLCIAGDFDQAEAWDMVHALFGEILAANTVTWQPKPEPGLPDKADLDVSGPGTIPFVQVGFRAPEASHPDFFAFTILDSLLAGPSSLNMFGSGSVSNRTSRLYHALVETELAVSIGGGLTASIDPGAYNLHLAVRPDQEIKTVVNTLFAEIERVQSALVSSDEIAKAVKQAKALFAYGSDNITNQAFWLGYANSFADYPWFENYVPRLEEVTPQDVLRVAQKYLNLNHAVTGVLHPNGSE